MRGGRVVDCEGDEATVGGEGELEENGGVQVREEGEEGGWGVVDCVEEEG